MLVALIWLAVLLRVVSIAVLLYDPSTRFAIGATLPTSLPTATTVISYASYGYTGTIPTQWGMLTKLTSLDLYNNELTGPLPTELGERWFHL